MEGEDERNGLSAEVPLGDPDVKVILLGDSAVGKSKLVERYLENDYNPRRVCVQLYFLIIAFKFDAYMVCIRTNKLPHFQHSLLFRLRVRCRRML